MAIDAQQSCPCLPQRAMMPFALESTSPKFPPDATIVRQACTRLRLFDFLLAPHENCVPHRHRGGHVLRRRQRCRVQCRDPGRAAAAKPLADVVLTAEAEASLFPSCSSKPRSGCAAEIPALGQRRQTGSRIAFRTTTGSSTMAAPFLRQEIRPKLYSGVAATPQVFDKVGLVVLGCNIHDRSRLGGGRLTLPRPTR